MIKNTRAKLYISITIIISCIHFSARAEVLDNESYQTCIACHGDKAQGKKSMNAPALAGQHAAYLEKQLMAFRQGADQPGVDGSRSNDGDAAIMRDIAEKMSDLEIKAVASFLSGLR